MEGEVRKREGHRSPARVVCFRWENGHHNSPSCRLPALAGHKSSVRRRCPRRLPTELCSLKPSVAGGRVPTARSPLCAARRVPILLRLPPSPRRPQSALAQELLNPISHIYEGSACRTLFYESLLGVATSFLSSARLFVHASVYVLFILLLLQKKNAFQPSLTVTMFTLEVRPFVCLI